MIHARDREPIPENIKDKDLTPYPPVREAKDRLSRYFKFYNNERPHQSLGYHRPAEVYAGS